MAFTQQIVLQAERLHVHFVEDRQYSVRVFRAFHHVNDSGVLVWRQICGLLAKALFYIPLLKTLVIVKILLNDLSNLFKWIPSFIVIYAEKAFLILDKLFIPVSDR